MDNNFEEQFFINPGIEYGIRNYISFKENGSFNRINMFEMYVIKALTIIYGEKSILLPYKIDNEKAFECNLLMYDLSEEEMHKFNKYMGEYYNFLKNYKSETKATGLINEIEKILIDMIMKRNKKKPFTSEELDEFDTIFNPSNGDLKRLKELVSTDQGLIIKAWLNNKEEITSTQYGLMAINPNLLDPKIYSKYGYDIRTIASLSENDIKNVNDAIIREENRTFIDNKHLTKKRNKVLLTTGSVFVDSLLIISMVATEIMIGFIIFASLWG